MFSFFHCHEYLAKLEIIFMLDDERILIEEGNYFFNNISSRIHTEVEHGMYSRLSINRSGLKYELTQF